jgi:Family of unknown function (DUF5723)
MYKRALISFAFICSCAFTVTAQRFLGVATGGYDPINGLYLNPASISGSNEKIAINIFSLNVGVDNNLGTLSSLGNIGNSDAFTVTGKNTFSMLAPVLDIHLPGIMVSLNDKMKQSFAFTTRVRAINQFNHFDPNLYYTVTSSDYKSNQSYTFESNNFNWTAHVWSEFCLSYALQVFESGPHKLKAGITLKLLGGIDYLTLKGRNLNATYTSGNDTFYANHSDLEFASNAVGSNDIQNNGVKSSDVLGSLFGSKAGSGFGMDIGVTYTYKIGGENTFGPKEEDDKEAGHRLTVSAAITDFGSIRYNDGNNFFVDVTGNGFLTGKELSKNIGNYSDFRNYMVNQGFTADTGSKATKLYMPTAMVLGVDYQIHKRFYINATYIANLANRQNYGNSFYNQLTFTPRYEYSFLGVGLPITYSTLASDMKVGLGFRVLGFILGSDDMMALFSNHQRGFGFYIGGFVPLFRKSSGGLKSIK